MLTSDDYSLKEQVYAYKKALETIEKSGDAAAKAAFEQSYVQYEYFKNLGDDTLDFLDKKGLGGEKLNDLSSA